MKKIIFILVILLNILNVLTSQTIDSGSSVSEEGSKIDLNKAYISLSIRYSEETNKKFYEPIKNYLFYCGDEKISKADFDKMLNDVEVDKYNISLNKIKFENIVSSSILGGLAFSFFIPSMIFVITSTSYSNNTVINSNYSNYLEYYKENYDYIILPGIISIFLTFSFTMATFINMGIHFYRYYNLRNNSKVYEDAIKRYNDKLNGKIIPDIGIKNSKNGENVFEFALTLRY